MFWDLYGGCALVVCKCCTELYQQHYILEFNRRGNALTLTLEGRVVLSGLSRYTLQWWTGPEPQRFFSFPSSSASPLPGMDVDIDHGDVETFAWRKTPSATAMEPSSTRRLWCGAVKTLGAKAREVRTPTTKATGVDNGTKTVQSKLVLNALGRHFNWHNPVTTAVTTTMPMRGEMFLAFFEPICPATQRRWRWLNVWHTWDQNMHQEKKNWLW